MTEFLARERRSLEGLLPGLLPALSDRSLLDLEKPDGKAIATFKQHRGPGLLIPQEHGGRGATPVEAVRVQRALGSAAPSLAVATTMHHFSVATLIELSLNGSGFEWLLIEGVAEQDRLLASGFAEGRAEQSILSPTLRACRTPRGYVVSGSKKPCSLSASMDILTASVRLDDGETGVALISASSPGVERRPFWGTPILSGAESDEIVLRDVEVESQLVVRLDTDTRAGAPVDFRGLVWFEMLITAAYLGIASGLVERLIHNRKASSLSRVVAAAELETCAAALEAIAQQSMEDAGDETVLSRALLTRYATQDAIGRAVEIAIQSLGGMPFISSPEIAYCSSAARALCFHPPSRDRNAERLAAALLGEELKIR